MQMQMRSAEMRMRAGTVLRAALVVVCYLIVFAGLLMSVAGAGVE